MTQRLRSGVGAGDQAQHGVDGNHRGAAVADERQGQADNGHNADAHSGVDHHLEHEGRGRAEAHQPAHIVRAPVAHPDAPGDEGDLHNHDQKAAKEAQLLADGGEDVVRVLGEEVSGLGSVAVEQTLAEQTAALNIGNWTW